MLKIAPPRSFGALAVVSTLMLAGCAPAPDEPSEETSAEPVAGPMDHAAVESRIPAEFRALGTEPFWAVTNGSSGLRYSTPEVSEGTSITVDEEIADKDRRQLSGMMGETTFSIELTLKPCSDGMSDRQYPFSARIQLGEQELEGCARPMDG